LHPARESTSPEWSDPLKGGRSQDAEVQQVLPNGSDVYLATFENGDMECTITPLSPTGKINGDFYHLLP
jgi:hypothetical protein